MGTVAPVVSRRANRSGLLDWLPLAALPALGLITSAANWPRWVVMWLAALEIFGGCKWLTWRRASARGAPAWRHVAYFIAFGVGEREFADFQCDGRVLRTRRGLG